MDEMRSITKIVNNTFIREMCHGRDVKISQDAIDEIAKQVYQIVNQVIKDTQEMEKKVILRRFVERRF